MHDEMASEMASNHTEVPGRGGGGEERGDKAALVSAPLTPILLCLICLLKYIPCVVFLHNNNTLYPTLFTHCRLSILKLLSLIWRHLKSASFCSCAGNDSFTQSSMCLCHFGV